MDRFLSKEHYLSDRTFTALRGDIRLLELSRRITWFLFLRLLVAGTFAVAAILSRTVLPVLTISASQFSLMSLTLLVSNGFFWWHYRRVAAERSEFTRFRKSLRANLHAQIILDFVVIAWLLYLSGGIESPVAYFFLFHVSLSCLFFSRPISLAYTALAVVLVLGQTLAVQLGLVQNTHFLTEQGCGWSTDGALATYYQAGVTIVYVSVWYLVSSITRTLRFSETELQRNVEQLVEMHREKTRYMLTTTHELKAPFTAIQSYVNVLLGGFVGTVDPQVKGILEKIRERCERMLTMINELLQLANVKRQVQAGAELVPVDLHVVVKGVLSNLESIRAAKQIAVDTRGMGRGEFWVLGDEEKLAILLTNVLANALHYTPDGRQVSVAFMERDRYRRVVISDRGIGIKEEHLEKVFLEHFRAEEAVAMNHNSTGLGLTICKFIIYMHRGRIWLESEVGNGTSVFMEFMKATATARKGKED